MINVNNYRYDYIFMTFIMFYQQIIMIKSFSLQNLTSIPTYWTIILKLILRILPIAQAVLMYLLGIIGVITSVLSLISVIWIFNQQQHQEQETTRSNDDLDLRIPLYNGQYTSINILPIKKISSKTDCLNN